MLFLPTSLQSKLPTLGFPQTPCVIFCSNVYLIFKIKINTYICTLKTGSKKAKGLAAKWPMQKPATTTVHNPTLRRGKAALGLT